jgi:hypothetical protein
MRVTQYTRIERDERERLKVIASDSTLSEAERELARAQMEQVRNAAVARMKLRELKDTQPANDTEPELALPGKPVHLDGETSEDYEFRIKDWQIRLDERAAQRVLDSPKSSHSARQSAARMLRKCDARLKELIPELNSHDDDDSDEQTDADAVNSPVVEINPFHSQHEIGSAEWIREFRERQNRKWDSEGFDLITWMDCERQWERQHPESYSAERNRRDEEDEERRRRNAEECSGNTAARSTVTGKPYVASPAQKAAWQAQSEKFARERGEIVEPQTAPAVERDVIFVLPDGFECFPDLSKAVPPFAVGAKFIRVPSPPGYSDGDHKIASGYVYDRQYTCWFRT